MFISPLKLSNQIGYQGYDGSITVFSNYNQNCSSLDFTFRMLLCGIRDSALITLFSYPSVWPDIQQLCSAVQTGKGERHGATRKKLYLAHGEPTPIGPTKGQPKEFPWLRGVGNSQR